MVFLLNTGSVFSAENKVIAYYFHGNTRCHTCHKMEGYAKEVIENNFTNELKDGELIFKAVNIDEKDNKHFVDKYQLYTKALVISKIDSNKEIKYKNLSKIWECVGNKDRFFEYVINEINSYLKE